MYRRISIASVLLLLPGTLLHTLKFAHVIHKEGVVDFDVFIYVSKLLLNGNAIKSYSIGPALNQLNHFPWTYPPQFDFLILPIASMPAWMAYLLFMGVTVTLYLAVMHKLAGQFFGFSVVSVYPAVLVNLTTGQNGFLTAFLMGLTCLWLLRGGRAVAGIPLGLMVIKPHLAVGLAAYALFKRSWLTITAAAAVVVLSSVLATLAFSPAIWPAFLGAISDAGHFLKVGYYPLYRMVSGYAMLRTLGLSASLAGAAQAVLAIIGITMTYLAMRRSWPPECVLSIAILGGLMISPYLYDYDLPVLGVAAAMLMPHLLRLAARAELAAMTLLSWTASGWGLLQFLGVDAHLVVQDSAKGKMALSLGALAYLSLAALIWRVLLRQEAPQTIADPQAPDLQPHPLSA